MRFKKLVFLSVPLGLSFLIAAAPPKQGEAPCKIAHAWATSHAGMLPTTMAEFSKYDRTYRRAIMGALTPEGRVRLWHDHFQNLKKTESFSREQSAFWDSLEKVMLVIFSEKQELVRGSHLDSLANEMEAKEKELFGEKRAALYFANFGGGENVSLTESKSQAKDEIPDCNCYTGLDDEDCGSGHCRVNDLAQLQPCNEGIALCGWNTWHGCNGRCGTHDM